MGFLKKVLAPASQRPSVETGDALERPDYRRTRPKDRTGVLRKSMGLAHFFAAFPNVPHLELLDLGGICESNVNYLSNRGCRIHTLDLLANFDACKGGLPGRLFEEDAAREFVEEYLQFPPDHFDAILVWDSLEHLDEEVLDLTVTRLSQILRPGGALLAFFHTQARGETVEILRYQIEDEETLQLQVKQTRLLPATFNNRGLERLFEGFTSVKFFLTRDNLREVIVLR